MNLRLLALGGAVACLIAVPLAMASAGPAGGGGRPETGRGGLAAGDGAARAAEGRTGPAGSPVGPQERREGGPASGLGAGAGTRQGTGVGPRQGAGVGTGGGSAADPKAPAGASSATPRWLGLGTATAARCGPELTTPDGIEAQTCVLDQGEDTWARTYYRNATGRALHAVLSFMGPGGRAVQMRCAVGADDEPATCETPREVRRGSTEDYTAVAEFARTAGSGPLLLRSGSNSDM